MIGLEETTRRDMILICQTLCKAGKPLSRLELARALEPTVIPDLRHLIEIMVQAGMLAARIDSAQHKTAVLRYGLTERVNCDSLKTDG